MSKVQSMINRIVSEPEFREALVDDPTGALQSVGVDPSAAMLETFEGLDQETMKDLTANIYPAFC